MKKKCLAMFIVLMFLASLAMVSIPVKPSPEVRVYVKMPDGYIPGTNASTLDVEVWIDSPPEWDNTVNGIVGWSMYVHVNPAVLQPLFVTSGGWLYDFCIDNGYYDHLPQLLPGQKNASDFIDICEFIQSWEILGVGAGGSGKLFTLTFVVLSETAYTKIDLYNAYYYTTAGTPEGQVPVDVVDDGQYNQPVVHTLTVKSKPFDGVDFTIDSGSYTTNATAELEEGDYTVAVPSTWTVGTDQYNFVEWEDASTNPVRSISLTADTTITATYEIYVPVYYTLTVESTPIDGIDFTIDPAGYTTNATVELAEGLCTVAMPLTWMVGADRYNFVEWEDASTNPFRSISLTSDMTVTATYKLYVPPPTVTFYVSMPVDGYIPGQPVGTTFSVDIYVNASELPVNSTEGMAGWGIDVQVDPDVLVPLGASGAAPGYFLYDFMKAYYPSGYSCSLLVGSIDTATGYMNEIAEMIMPTPPGGAGGTGKLVTLEFESKNETAYSPIDISLYQYDPGEGKDVWQALYMDTTTTWHDAETIDGQYNQPPSPVRACIRESPPGSWIPGVPVGGYVWVTVDIESPLAWDNTPQGIVGWTFSVHVDPAVLQPMSVDGASSGYWLYDFCFSNGYYDHLPGLLFAPIDPSTGDINDIAECIMGWKTLGKGAGGSSGPGWYGETYGLCRILFESKSETAVTLIDIYDAYYVIIDASAPEGFSRIPFDVVDDGQYNTLAECSVAIIEGPPQGYVNTPVTFDGSDSYDPDGGSIVSYLWDFGDGTVISTTNPTIVHTYTSIGTCEVTLVVTDDEDQVSDPDTHAIGIMEIEDPVEAMQELIETIESWNLPIGTEISLTCKLDDAIHLLDKGNENGAVHKLMAFINQVQAQRGKKLINEQAGYLISEAQRIIDLIEE